MIKPFTTEQRSYIERGKLHSEELHKTVLEAIKVTHARANPRRHYYIVSEPGLGKTYGVKKAIHQHNIDYIDVEGAESMANFVRKMALAVYRHTVLEKKTTQLYVVVDDCDEMFSSVENLNVMKGMLDAERNVLKWEKDMTMQIAKYQKSSSEGTQVIAMAMEYYQTPGGLGLTVPMDCVSMITLSNTHLADAKTANKKKGKAQHENAVRDRVNYRPINITGKQHWGWAAHILLTTDILGKEHPLSMEQKHILLEWMWHNWDRLPGTSLRSVQEYAADMLDYPDDYSDRWETKLTPQE